MTSVRCSSRSSRRSWKQSRGARPDDGRRGRVAGQLPCREQVLFRDLAHAPRGHAHHDRARRARRGSRPRPPRRTPPRRPRRRASARRRRRSGIRAAAPAPRSGSVRAVPAHRVVVGRDDARADEHVVLDHRAARRCSSWTGSAPRRRSRRRSRPRCRGRSRTPAPDRRALSHLGLVADDGARADPRAGVDDGAGADDRARARAPAAPGRPRGALECRPSRGRLPSTAPSWTSHPSPITVPLWITTPAPSSTSSPISTSWPSISPGARSEG